MITQKNIIKFLSIAALMNVLCVEHGMCIDNPTLTLKFYVISDDSSVKISNSEIEFGTWVDINHQVVNITGVEIKTGRQFLVSAIPLSSEVGMKGKITLSVKTNRKVEVFLVSNQSVHSVEIKNSPSNGSFICGLIPDRTFSDDYVFTIACAEFSSNTQKLNSRLLKFR